MPTISEIDIIFLGDNFSKCFGNMFFIKLGKILGFKIRMIFKC